MEIVKVLSVFENRKIISETDNFSNYECILEAQIDLGFQIFSKEEYDNFNDPLKELGYEWTLTIEDASYTLSQNKFKILELEDNIDDARIQISVFKKGTHVVIFNEEKFFYFLKSQSLQQILESLGQYKDGVVFINKATLYRGSTSLIGLNAELSSLNEVEIEISSLCNFGNLSQYKFYPSQFDFHADIKGDYLLEVIKRIHFIFNLIYLYDASEINENKITLKISGHKTFSYSVDFQKVTVESNEEYSKIFKWVYSETAKIEDKLGLARNILTVYLKEGNVDINDKVFFSILSANNTYIKENILRYLEIRNKVHSQVEQIAEKVSKSVETFLSNFQKSIFVFISFYLTIFVLKIYTKPDVSSILTRETTYMGLGLLGLSLIFLLFSNWLVYLDLRRIESKYSDIKERSLDLLISDDVDKILDNDREFKSEKRFLRRRMWTYNALWIITIIVFLIILSLTSDHLNFCVNTLR